MSLPSTVSASFCLNHQANPGRTYLINASWGVEEGWEGLRLEPETSLY